MSTSYRVDLDSSLPLNGRKHVCLRNCLEYVKAQVEDHGTELLKSAIIISFIFLLYLFGIFTIHSRIYCPGVGRFCEAFFPKFADSFYHILREYGITVQKIC